MPRINEVAPDFEAKTTHGVMKLSDITSKGKWVVLFSHPADFTPVCTTEFVEVSKRHDEFARRNRNCWAARWTAHIRTSPGCATCSTTLE